MDRSPHAISGPVIGAAFIGFVAGGPFVAAGIGADHRWIVPVCFQAFWCLSEGWTAIRNRPGNSKGESALGLARIISAGSILVAAVSFGELYFSLRSGGGTTPFVPGSSPWLLVPGVTIGLFGVGLRLSAIQILGDRFRNDVELGSHHLIETKGPYAWCRHPGELGFVLAMLGHVTMSRSAFGLILFLSLTVPLSIIRVRQEDRMLAAQTG
jgi:protein-S-isoprenylcysteine O-methyltransferase Ste14